MYIYIYIHIHIHIHTYTYRWARWYHITAQIMPCYRDIRVCCTLCNDVNHNTGPNIQSGLNLWSTRWWTRSCQTTAVQMILLDGQIQDLQTRFGAVRVWFCLWLDPSPWGSNARTKLKIRHCSWQHPTYTCSHNWSYDELGPHCRSAPLRAPHPHASLPTPERT